MPLHLLRDCCVPLDVVQSNLQQTFARPYRPFNELLGKHSGSVAIVGSGPSIHQTAPRITEADVVMSCNAAHEFLIARGIVPTYAMLWDAAEIISTMVKPHKDVTYLVASRCHPSVFKLLEGYKVVVWHAGSDGEGILERLEESGRMEPVVNGGSAAVVRAMFLVAAMGFTDVRLFGGDGSFEGEFTHFQKSAVPETEIRVYCNHRWFRTTAWLAAQAEEVQVLFPIIADLGVKITVHGDGLVPHIAETLGYEVHR